MLNTNEKDQFKYIPRSISSKMMFHTQSVAAI